LCSLRVAIGGGLLDAFPKSFDQAHPLIDAE